MDQFLQHFANTLVLGSTYALLGIGLTMIFGIMRIVNFAHGELFAFGAYLVFLNVMMLDVDFFLALFLAIVGGCLLGAVIELVLIRPLRATEIETTMLVTIGAWIVLQNSELLVWGGVAKAIGPRFPRPPLVLGPVSVSPLRLFVVGMASPAYRGHLRSDPPHQTRYGHARHIPGQRDGGANGARHQEHPYGDVRDRLGACCRGRCAARAGLPCGANHGDMASLKAFAVVIFGGLGNITGATIGGFLLAFIEELGAGYISSGYRDAMGFLLIIAVLLIKPTGLFARAERMG